MSKEQNHIRYLYNDRGRNDSNSTTLANTLDKDIQTVFNSPDKFVMELLQNADDATNDYNHQYIDITFQIAGQYLMFSHTGKHFDHQDVDAICDNAQQHYTKKKVNLNKTGYKGIGFKSVFVISECVYIISNKYCFRFDSQKWNHLDTSRSRYPWQIIPIWTDHYELPTVFKLNNSHVNFIFFIQQDRIRTVCQAINTLLKNPYTILFLRNIRQITVNINNKIQCIELRKSHLLDREYQLCINNEVNSRWFIISKQQEISNHIHDQLQELKDHECPVKLKNATSVNIQFAIELDSNRQVKPVSDGNLFCYLPTQVGCNLPFLVNADFLLSADRMQLLSNIWNTYLFECIAKFHIESLQMMAKKEQYCDDILTLFTAKLISSLHKSFIDAYNQTIVTALDEIAFIPSYLEPSRLLKYRKAVGDNLLFFIRFPYIDPSYQTNIAKYTLRHRNKLHENFTRSTLAERIHDYATQCLNKGCYEQLLIFMISTYPTANQQSYELFGKYEKCQYRHHIANKAFLLTIQNKLVSSKGTFLPLRSDKELQQFLSSLNANFIHPKLLNIPGLLPWMEMMNIRDITDDVLVDFITEWISNQGPNLINIELTNSLIIIQLLSDVSSNILMNKVSILKKLPLITKSGRRQPAEMCYLPSVLDPIFDFEKITGINVDIVDDSIYSSIIPDNNKLKSTLINLNVKKDAPFFCNTFCKSSDSSNIDCFDEYYNTYKDKFGSHGAYSYHIAYLPYMRYLKISSYAEVFFKCLHSYEDNIITGMTNFKPSSRSNKCSYIHDNVEHYLKFMLNREPCILGQDDQLYRMKDLYITSIIDKLDDKLKRLVPQMKIQFHDNTIKLSDQLMKLLGARHELSCQDTIKLLNAITDEDADRYHQIFQGLYELILKASWTTSQADKIRQHRVKLLASDNSRQSAASLHSFCCQYVRIQRQPNLFHSFPDITKQDELALCRCLGVQVLERNDYNIIYKQFIQNIPTDRFKSLLKFIVITVPHLISIKDKKKLHHRWMTELEKLQVMTVEGLAVQVKSAPYTTFKVEAIISAHDLYFKKELPLVGYIEAITQYIKLPQKQVEILHHLYLMDSDQQCEQHLDYFHYDISSIKKLDKICLLPDDIENDDDSNLKLTRKATFDHHLPSNDDDRPNLILYDTTEAHCSYTRTAESQHYKERERLEPAVKKLRLSKNDSQYRYDEYLYADDVSDITRPHRLQYSDKLMMASCNDDERESSSEDQTVFKPCLPAEAVKANVKLIRFEGNSDTSSDAFNTAKLGKVLPNVGHFDSNDLTIPLHPDNVTSPVVRRLRNHQQDKTSNQWTGRWGEGFAYRYFIKYYEGKFKSIRRKIQSHETTEMEGIDKNGKKRSITLIWSNYHQENNQPFDIKMIKNDRQIYIEVKSTYKRKDLFVKISHKEWECMCQYRNNYRLCCVYNAGKQGDAAPIIKQIKDPASKFFNGILTPREIHFKL